MNISNWNYRVVLNDDNTWCLREVYYDSSGEVVGWTQNDASPFGETVDGLVRDFALMEEAFKLPVLTEVELPGYKNISEKS